MRPRLLHATLLGLLLLSGCGEALKDESYNNPEWRSDMKSAVAFPLAEELTVTVGLSASMSRPESDNLSLRWLEERSGIRLDFVGLPESPGDVELGQMLRAGKLPDIVPEARIDLSDESVRRLFVNVLEFPSLTPELRKRLDDDEELRTGLAARSTEEGELYSPGSYHPDNVPYGGVLAYRRDLFEQGGLAVTDWAEITKSLEALKRSHPQSTPFGGYFSTMLTLMPSWFGSGYDAAHLLYFSPDRKEWVFGPQEDAFRDFVAFLADLYQRGILSSEVFIGQEDGTSRMFSTNSVFMGPWRGATGPFFPYYGDGYGKLTAEGEWNGHGAWIESLPLPPPPRGGSARASAAVFSRVGPGWLVYNQSPRASEALALLDLMYGDEVALVMALGPGGEVWQRDAGKFKLKDGLASVYAEGGEASLRETLATQGIKVGLDLGGIEWGFFRELGLPAAPQYAYYQRHDLASNRPGRELTMQPGLRIPVDSSFREERAGLVVSLRTAVESGVANIIAGRKSMDEYEAFREELGKSGAARLLELYRTRATLVDAAALFARR